MAKLTPEQQEAADKEAAAKAAADQAAADQAAADQQAADQLAAEQAAALLKEQDEKMPEAKKPATAFVPVFKDEDGDAIAINSILRVVTKDGALIDPNGVRITSHSPVEILGADVKEGDWYCVQYEAGLLAVQNTKLLK